MATIDGAKAMGLDQEIGSLEVGKRADVAVVNLNRLHTTPQRETWSRPWSIQLKPNDVDTVVIDGELVMQDRELLDAGRGLWSEAAEQGESGFDWRRIRWRAKELKKGPKNGCASSKVATAGARSAAELALAGTINFESDGSSFDWLTFGHQPHPQRPGLYTSQGISQRLFCD